MIFNHIGVITDKVQDNENYADGLKVHITDPSDSEFKFEYLRFEDGSPMPEEIQKNPHVAFMVEEIEPYLKANKVLMDPFMAGENLKIAFIIKDGLVMELMQEV